MTHNGIGRDLAFLYKKAHGGRRSNRQLRARLNKQTSETKVSNARNVFSTIRAPID